MGICFVGEKRRFERFLGSLIRLGLSHTLAYPPTLADYLPRKDGTIIDLETKQRVGTHHGLWNYTIGQNARIPGMPRKLYVANKIFERNEVHVAAEG